MLFVIKLVANAYPLRNARKFGVRMKAFRAFAFFKQSFPLDDNGKYIDDVVLERSKGRD